MKKFLSLVLSLAMTVSLVTISASATEYKSLSDKGEIQYEEAVAVLNKLGIITGYPDGSFKPTGSLTRGAAAKIIVSMMIGADAASALTVATAPYKDVPVTNTFAAVISYCKTKGYINGYTDGTFRPAAALSGSAFSKMLLGALGYDGTQEKFTGSGWTMNVASLGQTAGLFNDFATAFKPNDTVDRESACLLALNTLKATEVEYTGGTDITTTTGNATTNISTNKERSYKTSNNTKINKNIKGKDDGNTSAYLTLQFGEDHFSDLKLTADGNATDDYGRPSNEWSYKNVKIGTYAKTADYSYTTAASGDTASDKVKDMGLKDFKVDSTSYTENGLSVKFTNTADTEAGEKARMEQVADKLTANGTLVQLYLDEDNADTITNVVVIKTQMMQVNAVKSDAVSLKKLDDNQQDKEGVLNSDNTRSASSVPFKTIDDVKDDDTAYATLKDLKADDYVLVVPLTTNSGKSYTADKVAVPQSVSGKLTQIATKSSNHKVKAITVAGTAYTMSAQWTSEDNNLQVTTKLSSNTDTTVYLDTYGYAIYVKDVIDSNSSIVIDEIYSSVVNGRIVNSAKGWDSKGNELSLNLGSSPSFKGGSALPSNAAIQGKVYEYETYTGNDADYRLIPNATTYAAGSLVYTMANQQVINGQVSAKVDANKSVNFASDVKFIFESVDEDGDVTGITVHDGVTEVHKNDPATLHYILNKAGDKIVAVVVPDDDDAANTANLLYVQKVTGYKQNADGDTVAVFTAYIDGKEVTGCEYNKKDLPGNAFYTYSKNETTGVYTLSKYSESLKTTKATAVVTGYTLNGSIITGDDYFTGKYTLKDSSIKTLNAKNAQVVDLYTDDGVAYTSLKDMREAISLGKVGSFTVSYVYNGSDTTGAGTVAYIFITANNAGSGTGSSTGTGVGSSYTTEYTVASNGRLSATISYTAASWVKDAGAQTVAAAVEVYANGAYYDTIASQSFVVGTDGKATTRLLIPTLQNSFPTDEALTFKVIDETPAKVAVQYVDENNQDITGRLTGTLPALKTDAADNITFTVKNAGTGSLLKYTISGTTADVTTAAPFGTNDGTAQSISKQAKGSAYVVVKVSGLDKIATKYDITSTTANLLNGTGVAVSAFGVPTANVENANLLQITAKAGYNLTGNNAGDSVLLQAALGSAFDTTTYAVKVTVKVGGQTLTKVLTSNSAVDLGFVTMNANYEIADSDVTVEVVSKLTVKLVADGGISHEVGSKVYTITYDRNIASINSDGLVVAGTDVTTDGTDNNVVSATISGNKLIVTLAKELDTSKTISVVAGKIADAANAGNVNVLDKFAVTVSGATETWTLAHA